MAKKAGMFVITLITLKISPASSPFFFAVTRGADCLIGPCLKFVADNLQIAWLSCVLKYVNKTITNLEESGNNVYSALLFASNKRSFSIVDVRTVFEPNPLLETHHRATATLGIPRFCICI